MWDCSWRGLGQGLTKLQDTRGFSSLGQRLAVADLAGTASAGPADSTVAEVDHSFAAGSLRRSYLVNRHQHETFE